MTARARVDSDRLRRDRLILDNQRLVFKIARKISTTVPHVDFEDLVSAGNIGIIKAADRFDGRKASFSTFAYRYINGSISQEIRDKWQPVKIRRSHYETSTKLSALQEQNLTDEAIASKLEITVNELWEIRRSLNVLKTRDFDGADPSNDKLLTSNCSSDKFDDRQMIYDIFSCLPPKVKQCYKIIVDRRSPVTTKTIAEKLEVTPGRARNYLSRLLELDLIIRDDTTIRQNPHLPEYDPYLQIEKLKPSHRQVFDCICRLDAAKTRDIALYTKISQTRVGKYCKHLQELQLINRKGRYLSANFERVVIEGFKKQMTKKIEVANYLAQLEELVKLKQQVAKMEKELIAQGGDRGKWIIEQIRDASYDSNL